MNNTPTQSGASLAQKALRRFKRNKLAMLGAVIVLSMTIMGFSAPLLSAYFTGFSLDEQHNEFKLRPPGTRDISIDHPSYDGDLSHFDLLDRNNDGVIGGNDELQELRWINRFLLFLFDDYDLVSPGDELTPALKQQRLMGLHPDGFLEFREYPAGFDDLESSFRDEFAAFVRKRQALEQVSDSQLVDQQIKQQFNHLGVGRDALFGALDMNGDKRLSFDEVSEYRRRFRPFENQTNVLAQMDRNGDKVIARDEFAGAPVLHTFWLGTDHLGRDVLTRVFYGARISITIALLATFVSFVIGVTWGSIAGFYGGRVDSIMMRIVDVLYGLPFMFIVILLIVVFGRSTINLFIALGAVQWLTMSRVVRGQVITLKTREYVEAAHAIGVSRLKIVFRHLLRNTVGPVIVYATLMVPAIILEEAFLSFLGLGVQPPHPSWGNMITEGARVMESYSWLIVFPGTALALTLFSMNFVGDGIRDALDPQIQKD
jgi:oligopeptide transport system permease protein